MNDCDGMVILPLIKSHVYVFVISLCICDSIAQWLCVVSTIYTIFECRFISGLAKYVFERSLSGKKSQFLSKSGFCCYLWDLPLQPGYILSANTWEKPLGTNLALSLSTLPSEYLVL